MRRGAEILLVAGRAVAEMYHPREEMRAEEGRDELVDELKALLSFVKSGFTSSNQLDSSQFLKQSNTPAADAIREIYREVSALKSREASSENVLRVAKETLDARKKQIRTLTMVISNCFTDMADTRNQTIKKLQGKASLAGMGATFLLLPSLSFLFMLILLLAFLSSDSPRPPALSLGLHGQWQLAGRRRKRRQDDDVTVRLGLGYSSWGQQCAQRPGGGAWGGGDEESG
eukprot:763360-Hanusia_phi.AAC.4